MLMTEGIRLMNEPGPGAPNVAEALKSYDAVAAFLDAMTVLDQHYAADIPDATDLKAAIWIGVRRR